MNNERGKAIIALGSNLAHDGLSGGALLLKALDEVQSQRIEIIAVSSVWESAPWPRGDATAGQANYANAAILCDVGERNAAELVAVLQCVEHRFGRERSARWAARTLDLDLIDLDGLNGEIDGIIVPHPRAHERSFVLAPIAEIAPEWRHPVLGKTTVDLMASLPRDESLRKIGLLK